MRIHTFFIAGGLALLSGCQSLTQTTTDLSTPSKKPVQPAISLTKVAQTSTLKAVEVNDVWQRIRLGLHFPIPDQKLVNQYRQWYIKHPQHLERVSQRAEPFLYMIVEEIEKRDLPIELALLPIVESAFDPFAYSHGAASGLWQFTAPMAKYFGLKMNWWYDGRRDVPAATVAALDMLEYLYKKTNGNWLYAMAAYNTGEGRVLNAINNNKKQGKGTDFWSLDLPTETERYVPQMLALADVIKHADKYGIKLMPIKNKPLIQVVDIGGQIDLALAAELANMTTSELHKLNPGYNRWSTAPNGPHNLVLPVNKASEFALALSNTPSDERLNWERYKIKSGDSLGLIAQRYHTSVSALRVVNDIPDNTIVIGKHLLIPVAAKSPEQYAYSTTQRKLLKQKNKQGNKVNYTVKSGDSIWEIAKRYKVSTSQLASWNNMSSTDILNIGTRLTIWINTKSSALTRTVNYTVKQGDSLARIATKFKISVTDLVRWNALEKSKYIQPGQTLKLFVDMNNVRA
ncbi:LysM peptidoglycan-binding domain-containing protein [Shewanella sp. VB17]|uniref:lytic transglycosylase n=1 Tax=Shewanella sp. VB17 TaxID=2739432 RepID=UPI00156484EE|nr:LysM peptidoglycan-binding domain-containing protein [Shewanella sp. VB17]NRD74278.1 LysM peptidoglycan-binding domain-containing protein [Shewanella sp. VB17]